MALTAAIVGATAAVGSTVNAVVQSNNAKSAAKDAADKQAADEANLEKQAADKKSQTDYQQTQQQALARQKQSIAGNQGAASTIATSPLGVNGTGSISGGKTLLGM